MMTVNQMKDKRCRIQSCIDKLDSMSVNRLEMKSDELQEFAHKCATYLCEYYEELGNYHVYSGRSSCSQ